MGDSGIIGGKRSHDVLRKVLASRPPGKVLDAPAGTGVLSRFLRDGGWDVSCADIDPGHFQEQGFPFVCLNLNRDRLPYDDESFDAVVCANGLHRLFNPGNAVAEFGRVLRPGGSLYVTVNNYANISKRLHFLLYGSITPSINEESYLQTIADPEANFRNHLFVPQLSNVLEGAGFRIAVLRAADVRVRHRLMSPLAWLIRLGTLFVGVKKRRENRLDLAAARAVCPGGRYLYLEAVKP